MGVKDLWEQLQPVVERKNLVEMAAEGFLLPDIRGYRLGVDVAIWLRHVDILGNDPETMGANAPLRALLQRTLKYLRRGFLLYFVFDGPWRPNVKRRKRIRHFSSALQKDFMEVLDILGLGYRAAPGEAEYELVAMNRRGEIDMILTDDVDAVVGGGVTILRNSSEKLTGNIATLASLFSPPPSPSKSQLGASQPIASQPLASQSNSCEEFMSFTYSSDRIRDMLNLESVDMIMIALFSGGDYDEGVRGMGMKMAMGLVRGKLGSSLIEAVKRYGRGSTELKQFLDDFREQARKMLTGREVLKQSFKVVAEKIDEDWPDLEILRLYTDPIVSRRAAVPAWNGEIDVPRLTVYLCIKFEYCHEWALRTIRGLVWPVLVHQEMRRSMLLQDSLRSDAPTSPILMAAAGSIDTAKHVDSELMIVGVEKKSTTVASCQILSYKIKLNPEAFVDPIHYLPAQQLHPLNNMPIKEDKPLLYQYDTSGNASIIILPINKDHLSLWIPVSTLQHGGRPGKVALASHVKDLTALRDLEVAAEDKKRAKQTEKGEKKVQAEVASVLRKEAKEEQQAVRRYEKERARLRKEEKEEREEGKVMRAKRLASKIEKDEEDAVPLIAVKRKRPQHRIERMDDPEDEQKPERSQRQKRVSKPKATATAAAISSCHLSSPPPPASSSPITIRLAPFSHHQPLINSHTHASTFAAASSSFPATKAKRKEVGSSSSPKPYRRLSSSPLIERRRSPRASGSGLVQQNGAVCSMESGGIAQSKVFVVISDDDSDKNDDFISPGKQRDGWVIDLCDSD